MGDRETRQRTAYVYLSPALKRITAGFQVLWNLLGARFARKLTHWLGPPALALFIPRAEAHNIARAFGPRVRRLGPSALAKGRDRPL